MSLLSLPVGLFGSAARTSLLLVGVVASCALAHAQTSAPLDYFRPPIKYDIVPPGLSAASPFAATASGHFNDDTIRDAAVLGGSVVQVLLNPRTWNLTTTLPTAGVRDLDAFDRDLGRPDGLVTAGANGVELWIWSDASPSGFESFAIGAGWSDPRLVRVESIRVNGNVIAGVVAVWDAGTGRIEQFILSEVAAATPPAVVPYTPTTPITVAEPLYDLCLVDSEGFGLPALAVVDANGLTVYSFVGDVVQPSTGTQVDGSLLIALDPPDSTGPARIAWLYAESGSTSYELVRVGASGPEAPLDLGTIDPRAVTRGHLDRDDDLALGLVDGSARILRSACTTYVGGGGACVHDVNNGGTSAWNREGRPIFADFDHDGCDDLMLFDDDEATANLYTRIPVTPAPEVLSATGPGDDGDVWRVGPHRIEVQFRADDLISTNVEDIELIAWSWPDHTVPALDPASVGFLRIDDVLNQNPPVIVDGVLTAHIDVTLSEIPPALALEARALDDAGQTIDAETFGIPWACDIYDYFVDVKGYEPVGPSPCAPSSPPSTDPPDPPLGDPLAGMVKVPRLPPFLADQIPTIPR